MSKGSFFLLDISASAIVYWCQSIQKLLDWIQSLSVCSLLGLNRKTSFSPVQKVYSCTETAESCAGCTAVQCGVQGTNTRTKCHRQLWREHGPVRSGQCPVLIFIIGDIIVMSVWLRILISEDCDEVRPRASVTDIPGDMMGTVGVSWTPDTNTNKFYKNNNTRIYSPIKEAVHRDYSPLRETPREYFECLEDSECHDELFLLPEQVLDMDSIAVREDLSAIVPSFRSEDNAKYGFLSLRKYNEEYWQFFSSTKESNFMLVTHSYFTETYFPHAFLIFWEFCLQNILI